MRTAMARKWSFRTLLIPCLAIGVAGPSEANDGLRLDDDLVAEFSWREIGPTVFGGRIVDIELVDSQPYTILVASASGGLWRTFNNGTTWDCIFQHEGTISIGDIAVDQANPDTIWVGTGEANNQRSSYWGDGVYRTTDGGETWAHLGLGETHHVGRIVLDPADSNIAYVAALGHLYTFNDERGLYKTTDAGATWTNVLKFDETVGVVDVVLNPDDPDILYAASYERLRRPWNFDGVGPGSAIHKSTDGGETWTKLTGGLPTGAIGRIGLAIYPENPDTLYAAVSNQNQQGSDEDLEPDLGFKAAFDHRGFVVIEVSQGSSAAEAGIEPGDIVVTIDETRMETIWSLLAALSGKTPEDSATLVIHRGEEKLTMTINLGRAPESSRRRRQVGGEVYRSDDAGETWTRMNENPVGGAPAYYYGQIRVDPANVDQIYVLGVPVSSSSDAGKTWNNNTASSVHVDHHALVVDPRNSDRLLLGNDGGLAISHDGGGSWDHITNIPMAQFYAVGVDMQSPYHVYGGTQDNGTWGGPSNNARGITNAHWYNVGGGDGFYAQVDPRNSDTVYGESQFGAVYRLDKATGARASIRPQQNDDHDRYRFNWNSPILISNHNPEIIYFGGNRLFKSFNRGDSWPVVSPDLTTSDQQKIGGNVPHCTITTIAESAIDPNLLLVGTDDGLVQLSNDGGLSWTDLTPAIPGAPEGWWVSRVELSRHDVDVAYISYTGYREDDFAPVVYATTDGGTSWTSIAGNLPDEPVNVIREDPRNSRLLYVGTEMGVYASLDGGGYWNELDTNLPTVPVHDLVVHPRDRDLVIATHGRGFWISDVSALQELNDEVVLADSHLFTVQNVNTPSFGSGFGWSGDRIFRGTIASTGATISYLLARDLEADDISLTIEDIKGELISTLDSEASAGLHRLNWNLRRDTGQGQRQGRGPRRAGGRGMAQPGQYTAVLRVGNQEFRETFQVNSPTRQ